MKAKPFTWSKYILDPGSGGVRAGSQFEHLLTALLSCEMLLMDPKELRIHQNPLAKEGETLVTCSLG